MAKVLELTKERHEEKPKLLCPELYGQTAFE